MNKHLIDSYLIQVVVATEDGLNPIDVNGFRSKIDVETIKAMLEERVKGYDISIGGNVDGTRIVHYLHLRRKE